MKLLALLVPCLFVGSTLGKGEKGSLQVRLNGQWKNVCCNGDLKVSDSACNWEHHSANPPTPSNYRKLRDLNNNKDLKCVENPTQVVDCTCANPGSGEAMHGAPQGWVMSSLELAQGAPIFPNIGREACVVVDSNGNLKTKLTPSNARKWDSAKMAFADPDCPHFRLCTNCAGGTGGPQPTPRPAVSPTSKPATSGCQATTWTEKVSTCGASSPCSVVAKTARWNTCAKYCQAQGHGCVSAAEDRDNTCNNPKATLTCNDDVKAKYGGTSDMICNCSPNKIGALEDIDSLLLATSGCDGLDEAGCKADGGCEWEAGETESFCYESDPDTAEEPLSANASGMLAPSSACTLMLAVALSLL